MEKRPDKDNVVKVRRGAIFEAERGCKVKISMAISEFRRTTNGKIKLVDIQYLDDGSGRYETHIVAFIPDYSDTIVEPNFEPLRVYNKDNYDFTDEDGVD